MSLTTPTTAELRAAIVADIESAIAQTVPLLPKSFIRVLSTVLAAVLVTLYKYAGFTFLQMFVSTATLSATTINGKTISPLTEWGRLVGVGDPNPATAAELSLSLSVITTGGTLPSGTQFLHSPSGVVYLSTAAVLLDASTKLVTVRAVNDQSGGGGLGTIGNRLVGDVLSFVSPLPDVSPNATVDTIVTTAADAESEENYRRRITERFQAKPQGGAYADYRIWGEDVEGISRIYPYTGSPGEVDVYVQSATTTDRVPTAAQLTAVATAIELDEDGLATRRPAGAFVNTLAVSLLSFDVVVDGLVVDTLAQTQSDIEDGLTEYFLAREPFITGLSIAPRKDQITAVGVAGVVEDIVTAAGGIFASATVSLSGNGVGTYVLGEGEICKLGSLSFT